jgi:hypothetical protein
MLELDLDRPIYGARAFAEVLNRTVPQIYHDLDKNRLDAAKWGGTWTSTPRRLLRSHEDAPKPQRMNNLDLQTAKTA